MGLQGQDYWSRKHRLNTALIAEKEATIRRLEAELEGLRERRIRIGRSWIRSRREQK